jgi:hypothetical protein
MCSMVVGCGAGARGSVESARTPDALPCAAQTDDDGTTVFTHDADVSTPVPSGNPILARSAMHSCRPRETRTVLASK